MKCKMFKYGRFLVLLAYLIGIFNKGLLHEIEFGRPTRENTLDL